MMIAKRRQTASSHTIRAIEKIQYESETEVIDLRRAWIAGFLSEIENIDTTLCPLEAVNWARDHHWIPKTAEELSHEIAEGINGSVGKTYALSLTKKAG